MENIADRASAYVMPGVVVDGNDLIAVHEAAREAVARARDGKGPSLLEFKTYRWHHHFELDIIPDLRSPQEIETWKKKCPIKKLEKKLLDAGILDGKELEKINAHVMTRIEDAVTYAVESPFPDPEEALNDIYST